MKEKNMIPEHIAARIEKYPDVEESLKAFLEMMDSSVGGKVSIDALKVMEEHSDVEAVHLDTEARKEALFDIARMHPDVEAEVKDFVETVEREKKLHLSVDALKVLEKK